jgi:ABC-type dipeptide/oligopeptide/nickel transport system permease component
MEQKESQGAVRVGMVWGGIGGVIGFLVSLLGSVAGIIFAGFVGFSCGRRAAVAEEGQRSGALAGLVGGAIAAPVFVLGSSLGSAVAVQRMGTAEIAAMLSDMLGQDISADQAWQLFLLSLVVAAFIQAGLLVLVSVAAGAWATRKKTES